MATPDPGQQRDAGMPHFKRENGNGSRPGQSDPSKERGPAVDGDKKDGKKDEKKDGKKDEKKDGKKDENKDEPQDQGFPRMRKLDPRFPLPESLPERYQLFTLAHDILVDVEQTLDNCPHRLSLLHTDVLRQQVEAIATFRDDLYRALGKTSDSSSSPTPNVSPVSSNGHQSRSSQSVPGRGQSPSIAVDNSHQPRNVGPDQNHGSRPQTHGSSGQRRNGSSQNTRPPSMGTRADVDFDTTRPAPDPDPDVDLANPAVSPTPLHPDRDRRQPSCISEPASPIQQSQTTWSEQVPSSFLGNFSFEKPGSTSDPYSRTTASTSNPFSSRTTASASNPFAASNDKTFDMSASHAGSSPYVPTPSQGTHMEFPASAPSPCSRAAPFSRPTDTPRADLRKNTTSAAQKLPCPQAPPKPTSGARYFDPPIKVAGKDGDGEAQTLKADQKLKPKPKPTPMYPDIQNAPKGPKKRHSDRGGFDERRHGQHTGTNDEHVSKRSRPAEPSQQNIPRQEKPNKQSEPQSKKKKALRTSGQRQEDRPEFWKMLPAVPTMRQQRFIYIAWDHPKGGMTLQQYGSKHLLHQPDIMESSGLISDLLSDWYKGKFSNEAVLYAPDHTTQVRAGVDEMVIFMRPLLKLHAEPKIIRLLELAPVPGNPLAQELLDWQPGQFWQTFGSWAIFVEKKGEIPTTNCAWEKRRRLKMAEFLRAKDDYVEKVTAMEVQRVYFPNDEEMDKKARTRASA